MSDTYEKDTAERTSDRNLILLGCRADADIDYRDKKIKQLQKDKALLEKVVEAAKKISSSHKVVNGFIVGLDIKGIELLQEAVNNLKESRK